MTECVLTTEALEGFGPAGVAAAGAAAVDPSLPPGEPFSNDGVSVRSEGTRYASGRVAITPRRRVYCPPNGPFHVVRQNTESN
jgi:hypothetical protein